MFAVKIVRRIYDGSSFENSKNFAATIRQLNIPIPPFIGMIVLMPYQEAVNKVMVDSETSEVSCFLEDYYANNNSSEWDYQEKIDDDVTNGMTLIFSKPIPRS